MPKKYKIIDLFCGVGGFSKGFEEAGFNVIASYDIEMKFKDVYNRNHKKPVYTIFDLSKGIPNGIKDIKVDVIIGSPPCQGFSDARGCRAVKSEEESKRNNLPFDFIKIVENIRPKIALMENVSGMQTFSIGNKKFIDLIIKKFYKIGYNTTYKLLNSANFGVPQERWRVFILAIDKEFKIDPILIPHDLNNKYNNKKNFNTVFDAIGDLRNKPSEDGISEYSLDNDECTEYQKLMRSKIKNNKVYNHKLINKPTEEELKILSRLPEGKIYRSSRFGDKYIGVWELFKDLLKPDERELLHFLCRKRTNNEFKEEKGKYKEGYIGEDKFPVDENGRFYWPEKYPKKGKNMNRNPKEILESLLKNKWIRKKIYMKNGQKYIAYDINTKSGIRPMYIRLPWNSPSRTILTTFFRARELVHPTENRGLTLREGARIQSFPDDFIFPKNNQYTAIMIGNAVPPLMAFELAKYIKIILNYINDNKNTQYFKIITKFTKKKDTLLKCF
ncbi:MAG: DNA cytosine methyltransferase [Candidatus Helarchaeota archaeon]